MGLLWLTIGLVAIFALLKARMVMQIAAARRSGIYPEHGKATMADVERLLRLGNRPWAIRCYRELNKIGLAEARKAVDEMAAGKNSN